MVTCTIFSAEGIVLFTKSVDSLEFDSQECQNIAKYCVMSFNIWPTNRSFQFLDLGESSVWVLKLRLDEGCCYFISLWKREEEKLPNFIVNCDSLMILVAWKLSRKFENSRQQLQKVLKTITNIIQGSLEGGTFSDSIGSSDEIEDYLNDSDDVQEMKFAFEQFAVEGLSNVQNVCRCVLDNVESLLSCCNVKLLRLSIAKRISSELREYTEVYRQNDFDDVVAVNDSSSSSLVQVLGEVDARYLLQLCMDDLMVTCSVPKAVIAINAISSSSTSLEAIFTAESVYRGLRKAIEELHVDLQL